MELKDKIKLLPHSPGVYRYYDSEGTVIYVGKAKDLHKRVSQYFVPAERLNVKTRVLVSKIADLQYSVVDTEADALLLENNLIKQYKPRYNILLKDSKTYPWICVTGEAYPRVFLTRRVDLKDARYFGPYSTVMHARGMLDLFYENYPLRSCRYKIDSDTILRKKIRPCLDFHLGRCRGCCIGAVSTEEYGAWIDEIVAMLKGGISEVVKDYEARMKAASDAMHFEEAQVYKDCVERLQKHYARSIITAAKNLEADVFSLVFDGPDAFGNFLRIRGGSIVQSLNLGFKCQIEEDQSSVLSSFLAEIESKFGALSPEIIVPFLPDVALEDSKFTVPERGDKLSLLELSAKNAREYHFNTLRQREHTNPDAFHQSVLLEVQKALGMGVLPSHIECFDNSNIQGTNPVSSCVVFRDGVPSKKDYRKFKVKTVVGANDYATMKEVVNRRYSRMLAENPDDLPQLVVIDGGKGQLEFAWQALCELGIQDRLFVVGLAERMEEVYRVGDPYPLFLDRNSQSLKLLQHIRDEAHRFGITFHRQLRGKAEVHSALDEIRGVGPKTSERLLLHYGSVARIVSAGLEDLSSFVGPKLAKRIMIALNPSLFEND